ncbi:MAG: hypothetical protein A2X49_02175 [Lentisphaerae bacterium GWF2_52_8]|nr:MAG: hypothetical protein A2X49_02175 [Lentisphaerae bacterium GWF2_52_8]
MKEAHLKLLACPECHGDLSLTDAEKRNDEIFSGKLSCGKCSAVYPILKNIPRFVPVDNYASSFGLEWTRHAKTQYDSYSGAKISETRFFEESKWDRDLKGQVILEVGSGSGRFTEQALKTGATVVSLDYCYAVEVNYASNGQNENLLLVQGDIYKMPFKDNSFDKLFCFGVIQHTPDVKKSFMSLPRCLKSGGQIAVDVYLKLEGLKSLFETKYWLRPISKKMRQDTLYKFVSAYVKFMWPLACLIRKLPYGKQINWALMVADYRGKYELPDALLMEWAILDTFDMLSPSYDTPQTFETFRRWFDEAGLTSVEIQYGYNGIEGRARKA